MTVDLEHELAFLNISITNFSPHNLKAYLLCLYRATVCKGICTKDFVFTSSPDYKQVRGGRWKNEVRNKLY